MNVASSMPKPANTAAIGRNGTTRLNNDSIRSEGPLSRSMLEPSTNNRERMSEDVNPMALQANGAKKSVAPSNDPNPRDPTSTIQRKGTGAKGKIPGQMPSDQKKVVKKVRMFIS